MNDVTAALQGTEEWRHARLGKATASRMGDLTARTKTGYGATRANYAAELVVERLTGVPTEGYRSAAMERAIELEPEARAAYELRTGEDIRPVGFVGHPTIRWSGASPDGLVGRSGLVQIKCPYTATHIETLLGASLPKGYYLQMLWEMVCAGRDWCDYISYDPRLPPEMRLHIRRVPFVPVDAAGLTQDVLGFLTEVEGLMDRLQARYPLQSLSGRLQASLEAT